MMKSKLVLTGCVGMLLYLLTGCSAYTLVDSQEAPGTNLEAYRTFRIAAPTDGALPSGMSEVTYYNIAAAIREQLVERGFVESPQADLLVNFGITVQTGETAVPYTNTVATTVPAIAPPPPPPGPGGMPPRPGGPRPFAPMFVYPRTYYTTYTQWVPTVYQEGTMIMDLVDLPQKQMLYTSSVATILDGSGRLQSLEGIAQAVKVLFSKFPVPLPKQ